MGKGMARSQTKEFVDERGGNEVEQKSVEKRMGTRCEVGVQAAGPGHTARIQRVKVFMGKGKGKGR
jgi:hypothetical protein